MDGDFATALMEASPIALLVVDALGTITYASPTAETLTGYGVGDVVGTSIFDYLVEEAVAGIVDAVGYVQDNPDVVMGPLWLGFRHADGQLRILEVNATNRYADPLLQGLVVSVRDQTTQFRLNEALSSHGAEADQAEVLRLLATAMLGLPVRGRAAFVDPADGHPLVQINLPEEIFGPAPDGWPARPWQRALADGEGVFPPTLDDYDPELRAAAAAAGLTTIWAQPVRAAAASGRPFASCLVVGRVDREEVTQNERINVDLVVRNAALVFERDFYVETLSRAARSDALTGLANRAHLLRDRDGDERTEPDATRVPERPGAVLYVDLDDFKAINDDLGHRAGDAVLVAMAERMAGVCRRRDELGRIGGDEFVLFLWDAAEREDAVAVAERILALADEPIEVAGPDGSVEVHVGASVGIALSRADDPRSLDMIVHAADEALYDAKRAGRRTWRMAGAGVSEPA